MQLNGLTSKGPFTLAIFAAISSPNAAYFIILLCLKPDNFTCQGESTGAQWELQ
jgi:hypothetical protein